MLKNDIQLTRTVTFLGRNGMFKQKGISVMKTGETIMLQPITSKDIIGRAWLEIPVEDVDRLIQCLKNEKEGS